MLIKGSMFQLHAMLIFLLWVGFFLFSFMGLGVGRTAEYSNVIHYGLSQISWL